MGYYPEGSDTDKAPWNDMTPDGVCFFCGANERFDYVEQVRAYLNGEGMCPDCKENIEKIFKAFDVTIADKDSILDLLLSEIVDALMERNL